MCFFQSPLFLPLLLLALLSPFLAWFVYSKIAKFAFRRFWTKWYVRRAVDVSFVGFLVLFSLSFLQGGNGNHYSDDQRLVGERIRSFRALLYETHSPYEGKSEKLYSEYWDLDFLLNCQWFLDNLGSFVLVPTGALVAMGYTIERSKQTKAAT